VQRIQPRKCMDLHGFFNKRWHLENCYLITGFVMKGLCNEREREREREMHIQKGRNQW
jgi:hypothetical protein